VSGVAGGGEVRDAAAHNAWLRSIAGRIAQLGGWTIELPARRLTWSDEVCDMHGMPHGYQPRLDDGIALFAPGSRATMQRHLDACIRDGIPYDLELEKVTADGRRVWVRTIGQAVRDASGRIVRIEGAIQDITDRKHADALLREQAALLDKARDAIVVLDLGGRVRYWNQGAERLYGWSAAEAVGRQVTDLLYSGSGDLDAFREADAAVRATGAWTGEIEQRTMAGGTIVVEGRWTLVRDAEGRPTSVLAIDTDVTGRKALEQQLLRAQRMESIGTLAGGIAHDLNNVLTPILMSIELLKRDDGPESRRATIAAIETSALKGAEMVRQVLSFARGVEGRRADVCVSDLVADVETIANDTFLKTIRIVTEVPGDLPTVLGDSTQLHQVLLNLCVNARDAMADGGTIAISARREVVDARAVAARACPSKPSTGSSSRSTRRRSRAREPASACPRRWPSSGATAGSSTCGARPAPAARSWCTCLQAPDGAASRRSARPRRSGGGRES
jgi:PAS domain S-box-containing protein